jgi:hypothetical protein
MRRWRISHVSRSLLGALAVAHLFCATASADIVRSYTIDVQSNTLKALPLWLDPATVRATPTFSTIEIPITPPKGGYGLAVTIYFSDDDAGFLRVLWDGAGVQQLLAHDLKQRSGVMISRTLLIPEECLQAPGTMVLQSPVAQSPVRRVHMEWLVPAVTNAAEGAMIPALLRGAGQTLLADEVTGEPYFPLEDVWGGEVISAPLSDRVERLDAPTAFVVELEAAPRQARLQTKIAVSNPDQPISVYLNGNYAGVLGLHVPDLLDPGYVQEGETWRYYGWMDATLLLPHGLLRPGENLIEFQWPTGVETERIALKDLVLQLRYGIDEPPAMPHPNDEDTNEALPSALGAGPEFMVSEPPPSSQRVGSPAEVE